MPLPVPGWKRAMARARMWHYKRESKMIGLKCPKCQTVLKVDEAKAGTATTCPGCGGAFRIPNLTRPKPGGAQGGKGQGSGVRNQGSAPPRTVPDKQTAIHTKSSKPPLDPSVPPARTS